MGRRGCFGAVLGALKENSTRSGSLVFPGLEGIFTETLARGLSFTICTIGAEVLGEAPLGFVIWERDLKGLEEVSRDACLHQAFVLLCTSEPLCEITPRQTA